jgi:hypothetical protein
MKKRIGVKDHTLSLVSKCLWQEDPRIACEFHTVGTKQHMRISCQLLLDIVPIVAFQPYTLPLDLNNEKKKDINIYKINDTVQEI